MSLILSRSCEYGIQATFYISLNISDELLSIKDISTKLNIPSPYLAKILQNLSKRGILSSTKGPNGGFRLGRSAEMITIKDIVESIDGLNSFEQCFLGFGKCGSTNKCPIHDTWVDIKKRIIDSIYSKSIADFGPDIKSHVDTLAKQIFY